ncbi:MAG: DUF2834 domain-containing protein [Acidobacteria bacterium]|nr:DUF2834 domain-containing protein [Acidobacteriota bacterium]MCA1609444.1 DUF2834 domain-containing protein [Acidobacteriota bacterium]
MTRRHFYLALCLLGSVLPYSQFLPWLAAHGIDVPLFVRELFANRIAASFALDVLVSAVVVCGFILAEGRRLGMTHLWIPVAAVCLVGVSCGLPLFLYRREGALERSTVR